MVTVEDYLSLGYRGIVIISSEFTRERSGFQDEHTHEVLACFDQRGRPLKLTFHWIEKFGPRNRGKTYLIEARKILDQDDYQGLAAKHGVRDDFLYHQKRAAAERRKREAEESLDKMIPVCPLCKNKMIIKYRRKDNKPFWSCLGFSRGMCKGSVSITKADYVMYDQLINIINAPYVL